MKISNYKYEKVEVETIEFKEPSEPCYYFETGIRRSIRIIPVFFEKEKTKKLQEFQITCIYQSYETKIEKFVLYPSDIEKIYHDSKNKHYELVKAWVDGWLDVRTKEKFENDFKSILLEFNKIPQGITFS